MKEDLEPVIDLEEQESDDLFEHQVILVDPGQKPIRIDKFLTEKLERTSRNRIQNAIKNQAILVNDQPIKPNFIIKPLHKISLVLPRSHKDDSKLLAERIPLAILYEDDHLMVINKPAGLVVHPGVGNWTGTLLNALAWHFLEDKPNDDSVIMVDNPALVHRIDKDTSGVMVVPKSEEAATHLAKQFFDHTIDRTYQALVWGEPQEPSGTVETMISRHPKNRLTYWVNEDGDQGKFAVTHYKLLESLYFVSLIECKLETGRTHQIRVHMQYLGHPLFSDARYGGDQIHKGTIFTKYKQFVQNCFKIMPRQALHAKSLGFVHPHTKEYMFFETQLPLDFQEVLDKWRGYLQSRKDLMDEE